MRSMTAADPIVSAITNAMSWRASESGPSYSEVRSKVDATIHGEIDRLRAVIKKTHACLTKASLTPAERVVDAVSFLSRELS